ncbi:nucleoside/nucleotide kinase family protein [Arachnia propionica]|uniref:nucleoside/nucleotide kinase family protein n=1 Tax=Arachnia propionica TaxID=1750 RepID=UPI0021AD6946|nr:nucleoside/nucleotide kinase family protein [Arachnia propionica]
MTPPTIDIPELAERARRLRGDDGGRALLGIVGCPGAGKSTLSARLGRLLGDRAVIVPMDGFHLDNPVLETLGRRGRKGAIDTFDVAGFVSLLVRLAAAEEAVTYAPRFDRSLETSVGSAIAVPREVPLVIVEGLYLLAREHGWERVRPLLDEVWYLEVPTEERIRRLVARRMRSGEDEATATDWVLGVDQNNAARVEGTREHADLIVELP